MTVVTIGCGVLVGIAYLQTYHVYKTLRGVTPALASARRQLAKGTVPVNDDIGTASGLAATALAQIDHAGFAFRFTGALPFLGRPIDGIRLATDAADQEAQAAGIVKDLVVQMLGSSTGDTSNSAPPVFHDGVIDVKLIESIAPRLEELVQHLQAAQKDVEAIPHIPFVSRVDTAKETALSENSQALSLATRALAGAKLLPGFLGADGPRNYFLALQNNADQRGTGGAVLAYALLNITQGKISLAQAGPIIEVDQKHGGFSAPLPAAALWYANAAGVPHRIANINYSPDFPTAAETWVPMIKESVGTTVDGVIALDPFAVAAVLVHERPIQIKPFNLTLDSAAIVKFVEHDQYLLPTEVQKVIPGLLITAAYATITSPKHFLSLVQSMSEALADKHVQIWSGDAALQSLVAGLGWDGAIRNAGGGDYLALAYEKRIVGKQDFFLQQNVEYDVAVNGSGGISSSYHLTATNATPQGEPIPVSGPASPYAVLVGMWNLYVPAAAHFTSVTPSGELPQTVVTPDAYTKYITPKGFLQHTEGDFRVFTKTGLTWPGGPYNLTYRYTVPGIIQTTPEGKVYTLSVQQQPFATPMSLTVKLTLPKGSTVTSFGAGWVVEGNVATFTMAKVTRDFTTQIVFS